MNGKRKAITVLAVTAIFGLSTVAFAGWGRGNGRMAGDFRQGNPQSGYSQGYTGSLSAEELEKLNKDQAAFYKDTEDIRRALYQKNLELRVELAKETPDAKKASALQGEISALRGELDQKRIAYQLKAGDSGLGYNRGYHGRGGGYGCW